MWVLLWVVTIIAPSLANGEQIFGELCSIDEHCIGHLICEKGRCSTPYPPNKRICARIGFSYKDKNKQPVLSPWDLDRNKRPIQCPPFCGFEEHLVYGPICVLDKRGCARSEECQVYGRCGFNGTECVPTEQGCKISEVCRDEGWCAVGENFCQLNEQGCKSSQQCKELGYCGLGEVLSSGNPLLGNSHDTYETRCVVTPKGCAFSQRCLEKGICSFRAAKVDNCEGSTLKCFHPATCVAGPPSPESYSRD